MKSRRHVFILLAGLLSLSTILWVGIRLARALEATTTANQPVESLRVTFSCLGNFVSPLGPVSRSEADTAELFSLKSQFANAWFQLRPTYTSPEDPVATARLRTEEANTLYDFTRKYPASFWTPPIQSRLASYYRAHGSYSRALELFSQAWDQTKTFDIPEIKQIADVTLVRYLSLLARLGRVETLTTIFEETANRRFPYGSDSYAYSSAREAFEHMKRFPGSSYQCGTMALANAANFDQQSFHFLKDLLPIASPAEGFSLASLGELSDRLGAGFVPVFCNNAPQLVVPSVVHWKANHYAAIVAKHGSWYAVKDPTFDGQPVLLREEEILAEASGFFMVPANKLPQTWTVLRLDQSSQVFGRGYPTHAGDPSDEADCPRGSGAGGHGGGPGGGPSPCGKFGCGGKAITGGDGSATGMPQWSISEPYANVWLTDIPLSYQPALGPEMAVRLMYRQRGDTMSLYFNPNQFSLVGQLWELPWRSVVSCEFQAEDGAQTFYLYTPAGSQLIFTFTDTNTVSAPEYFSNATLERVLNPTNSVVTSVKVRFPDGAYDVYAYDMGPIYFGYNLALTSRFDPQGHETQIEYFTYDADLQGAIIKRVIDPDGNALTFTYDTTAGRTNYITQITDSAGRSTKLRTESTYNTLQEITDAVDITNKFTYLSSGEVETFITPYGTNSFDYAYARTESPAAEGRVVTVTEPGGGKQRYAYWTDNDGVQNAIDPKNDGYSIPSSTPLNTFATNNTDGNTFYWDARNFEHLSSDFKADPVHYPPSADDYMFARGRHWLGDPVPGGSRISQTLAAEIDPSPDGINEGQITWYDYEGKTDSEFNGTQILPSVVARIMPDSTVYYKYTTHSSIGDALEEIEQWVEGGVSKYRTNSYTYGSNGIDLVEHRFKASGVEHLVGGYGYNSYHQPTSMTNALGEVATWTYDSSHRQITYQNTAGMISSNTFGGDGYLAKAVVYESGGGPIATNQYTWMNTDILTKIDARGLTTTNTWDGLHRLTKVQYPDGSYIQHAYTNGSGIMLIDRTYTRDRMTNITRRTYTVNRQLQNLIDPLGNTNHYEYCICGALESITTAYMTTLAETTDYFYDYQSRITEIDLSNGSWKTNAYDAVGRLTVVGDPLGSSTNTYDNLNRLVANTNAFGQVFAAAFDTEDNATSRTDENGTTITATYDDLHRLRTRTFPDSGSEAFGYTANVSGPTSYTNLLSKVTTYDYDKFARKKSEVVVGLATNTFTFSPAGDLLTLTDGKSQTTTWGYNTYGYVVSKKYANGTTNLVYGYDASGRLTNRNSTAFGDTKYKYDAVGNLTNVDYPSSSDLTFQYDAHNRSTNEIVAGTFTNSFTYFPGGMIATEDGPFANDTVTYSTNTAGLRATLSIQQPTGSFTNSYTYDAAHRLTNITASSGAFIYDYYPTNGGFTASTRLVRKLTLPPGSYITNSFDNNGRELETRLMTSANAELNDHSYVYNLGSQRTTQTRTDDSFVTYTYDDAGELFTAFTTNSVGSEITSERYKYGYDAAWNMIKRTNNTTVTTYTVNNLNQATGFYIYDSNGNGGPNSDTVVYDDENRLTSWTSGSTRYVYAYDARGRLRRRQEFTFIPFTWTFTTEIDYIYDGMLAIQERDGSNVPQVTYTRGLDLGGSYSSAGGIGGLLARSSSYASGSFTNNLYFHADGSGNITYLMKTNQTSGATYKYDPFGRTITSSGTYASLNTYRFSSKDIQVNSGFYYYGYRFYDPITQRWLNKDPYGERGFETARRYYPMRPLDAKNGYTFVWNSPNKQIDPSGLSPIEWDTNCGNYYEAIDNELPSLCDKAKKNDCFNCIPKNKQLAMNDFCNNNMRRPTKVYCSDPTTTPDCASNCGGSGLGTYHPTICVNQLSSPGCPSIGCIVLHEAVHAIGGRGESCARDLEKCLGCQDNGARQKGPK